MFIILRIFTDFSLYYIKLLAKKLAVAKVDLVCFWYIINFILDLVLFLSSDEIFHRPVLTVSEECEIVL